MNIHNWCEQVDFISGDCRVMGSPKLIDDFQSNNHWTFISNFSYFNGKVTFDCLLYRVNKKKKITQTITRSVAVVKY